MHFSSQLVMTSLLVFGLEALFTCKDPASEEEFETLQNYSLNSVPRASVGCFQPNQLRNVLNIKDKSSCPWTYRTDSDNMRIPRVLHIAELKRCPQLTPSQCMDFTNDKRIFPNKVGRCAPIKTSKLVLKKVSCGNGRFKLTPEKINLVTGFTCVYSSNGLSNFYSVGKRRAGNVQNLRIFQRKLKYPAFNIT